MKTHAAIDMTEMATFHVCGKSAVSGYLRSACSSKKPIQRFRKGLPLQIQSRSCISRSVYPPLEGRSTYLLTVSESPTMQRCLFALVIATQSSVSITQNPWAKSLTVQSSLLPKKSHFVLRIAPHQTYNDRLLLSPLESINTAQFKSRVAFFQ
jgi:hypothetical protein